MPPTQAQRTIALSRPLDLRATLVVPGLKGPSLRARSDGLWRATRTPEGPVTVRLTAGTSEVTGTAWGPGSQWALDRLDDWIGEKDDPDALVPMHDVVEQAARRAGGMRLPSVGSLVEVLVPTIVAQKVTGVASKRSYQQLVARYGEKAPGPGPVRLAPEPELLARLPYYDFHPLGIEQKRARTIIGVCRDADRIEATMDIALTGAMTYLRRLPGIGPWTIGSVMRFVRGDPDSYPVGDYNIPNQLAWALAGEERGSDERAAELLEPYRGQRGRVVRLIERFGPSPPAYGPRLAPRNFRAH